jgi:hypothetical protein
MNTKDEYIRHDNVYKLYPTLEFPTLTCKADKTTQIFNVVLFWMGNIIYKYRPTPYRKLCSGQESFQGYDTTEHLSNHTVAAVE